VTILESREREKGSNNDSESSLETEMEAGTEAETEAEMVTFSFIRTVFSVKRTGDCFSVGGGDHFFKWYDRDRQTL
jgi:hypothetical protein